MSNAIMNLCMLFAEDVKPNRSILTKEDESSLQEDIDSLVQRSLNWQLPFNVEKMKNYVYREIQESTALLYE